MPFSKGLKAKYSRKSSALKKGKGYPLKTRKTTHSSPKGDSSSILSANESSDLFPICSEDSESSFNDSEFNCDIFKANEELLNTVEQELKSLEEILKELSIEDSVGIKIVDSSEMGNILEKHSKRSDSKANPKLKSDQPIENEKQSMLLLKSKPETLGKLDHHDPKGDMRLVPASCSDKESKPSVFPKNEVSDFETVEDILKNIDPESFNESRKHFEGIPPNSMDILEDIKERILEDYKKDKELTDEEKSRLREIIINAGNEILPGKKLHKILDSNTIFTTANSEVWKNILTQAKFPKEILENYTIPEEVLWPWISPDDLERMKEIDSELVKLNEANQVQLDNAEIKNLLTESQDSLGGGDEEVADNSLFKSFLEDFETETEGQNLGVSEIDLQSETLFPREEIHPFGSETHSLENVLGPNPKD